MPLPDDWGPVRSTRLIRPDGEPGRAIGFESASLDEPLRTVLDNPAIQFPHITTYYFQHEFDFDRDLNDSTLEVWLDHFVDDGAVFYLRRC